MEDNFGPFLLSYVLLGLDGEHYPADLNTDTVAMYLKSHQSANGQWAFPPLIHGRPSARNISGRRFLSMRALQLYAPKTDKAAYDRAIQLAVAWIAKAQPKNNG